MGEIKIKNYLTKENYLTKRAISIKKVLIKKCLKIKIIYLNYVKILFLIVFVRIKGFIKKNKVLKN